MRLGYYLIFKTCYIFALKLIEFCFPSWASGVDVNILHRPIICHPQIRAVPPNMTTCVSVCSTQRLRRKQKQITCIFIHNKKWLYLKVNCVVWTWLHHFYFVILFWRHVLDFRDCFYDEIYMYVYIMKDTSPDFWMLQRELPWLATGWRQRLNKCVMTPQFSFQCHSSRLFVIVWQHTAVHFLDLQLHVHDLVLLKSNVNTRRKVQKCTYFCGCCTFHCVFLKFTPTLHQHQLLSVFEVWGLRFQYNRVGAF